MSADLAQMERRRKILVETHIPYNKKTIMEDEQRLLEAKKHLASLESELSALLVSIAEETAKQNAEKAKAEEAEKAKTAEADARKAKYLAYRKASNLYYYGDENTNRWDFERKQSTERSKEVARRMKALKEALSPLEKELLKYWEDNQLDAEDDDSEDRALPTLEYTDGYLEEIEKAKKFPFTKSEAHNWMNNYGGSSGVAPRIDEIVDAPQSPFDCKDSDPKNPLKWLEENFDAYYEYQLEKKEYEEKPSDSGSESGSDDSDGVEMPDYYGIKTLFITVKDEAEKAKAVEWLKAWKKVGELLNSENDMIGKMKDEERKKENAEREVRNAEQKIKNKELLLDYLKNKKYTRAEKGSKVYGKYAENDVFVYGNLEWITPAVISFHAFGVGDYTIYIREPEEDEDKEEHILISVKDGTSPTPEEAIAHIVSTLEKELAPAPAPVKRTLLKLKKPDAPISIPKKEFVAEHKELVQVLKKDEPKAVAQEAKKQEAELKTTLKKDIEKHTNKEIADIIREHLKKHGKSVALSGKNKAQLLEIYKQIKAKYP